MQNNLIEFLTLLNTSIGISKPQLAKKMKCSLNQVEHLFSVLTLYQVNISQFNDTSEPHYFLKQNGLAKRYSFNFYELLSLCQADIYAKLNQSIKMKLHGFIGSEILNLLHDSKLISNNQNYSNSETYELHYFSRKSNSFEKRIITPIKELRIGSQLLLEGYCFKRKAIRWFEIGRIKQAKLMSSYTPVPEDARIYFKQAVIQCTKRDLPYLKWAFQDIIIAYNQNQLKIRYSEIENIIKELAPLKNSKLLNNHSN